MGRRTPRVNLRGGKTMPERIDVDRALAILEGDDELTREPDVRLFVRWPVFARTDQIAMAVPREQFSRGINQVYRLRKAFRRWACENVAVPCRRCGSEFYREKIRQVNCRPCIELLRSVVKGGDHA
jgi:hypothetical protein